MFRTTAKTKGEGLDPVKLVQAITDRFKAVFLWWFLNEIAARYTRTEMLSSFQKGMPTVLKQMSSSMSKFEKSDLFIQIRKKLTLG